jgi:CRISPR/Cas system Type II protein with McrA/HNH and RuvC-like nuclease domain
MKCRLSFDLGTSSIGWTALDVADPEKRRFQNNRF